MKIEMKEREKENNNNMEKTEIKAQGITLVALVITVVILIILATVTVNVAFGDGGLIDQAKLAAEKTANSIYDEEASLANLTAYLNSELWGSEIESPNPNQNEIVDPEPTEDTEDPVISSFTETEVTENSITVSVTATDNSDGALKYEYKIGNGSYTTGGATYTFSGLEASTQYTLTVKVTDEAGNSKESSINVSTIAKPGIGADEIKKAPASYYGKVVTGYTCDSPGVTTWRIFYADESNIYLIADDYISAENAPDGQGGSKLYKNSTYKLSFDDVYKDYSGASWISQNSKGAKWLSGFLNANSYNTSSSTNENIRAVAYMMDTNVWSIYAGEDAEYAMGGPTLELFCASYKDTHLNRYIECSVTNANGYSVKWSDAGSYSIYISGLTPGEFNKIYIKSDFDKADFMWLASPSANDSSAVGAVRYDGYVDYNNYGSFSPGLRPLVCLRSEVQLEAVDENTYKIVE